MLWVCLVGKQVLPYSLLDVSVRAFVCVHGCCKLNTAWLILNCIVKIPWVHFRGYQMESTALQQMLSYTLPFFTPFWNFNLISRLCVPLLILEDMVCLHLSLTQNSFSWRSKPIFAINTICFPFYHQNNCRKIKIWWNSFGSVMSTAKLWNSHQLFIQVSNYWKIKWSKA